MASLFGVGGGARAAGRHIVEPVAGDPARISAGGELQAVVRLRLPLTPPPGVQQPRAWEGWTVRLRRQAQVGLRGAPSTLEYTTRLLRIRPAGEQLYRISAKTLPWMPAGSYDLAITGPGFEGHAPGAVTIGPVDGSEPLLPAVASRRSGAGVIVVTNDQPRAITRTLELVLPAQGPGLELRADGKRLEPTTVGWARTPNRSAEAAAPRLLGFVVELPPATAEGPATVELRYRDAAPAAGCRLALEWEDARTVRPTDWQTIGVSFAGEARSLIWDFGDGEWGAGPRARHRWLFDPEVVLRVDAFDSAGRVCSVAERVALVSPTERPGCSCGPIGAPGPTSPGARNGPGTNAALGWLLIPIFFLSAARSAE